MGAQCNRRRVKPCHSTLLPHDYTAPQGRKNWAFLTQFDFNQQEEIGTTNPNLTLKLFTDIATGGEMFTDRRTRVGNVWILLKQGSIRALSSACSFTFQRAHQAGSHLSAC